LTCDICRAEYQPPTQEHYEALSRPEVMLTCPGCGSVLVCHWCKTPYDGASEAPDEESAGTEV
jgi:hypothetical protein